MFLFSGLFCLALYSQDTIVCIDGKMKTEISVVKIDSNCVCYSKCDANGQMKEKPKVKALRNSKVFEVRYKDGSQKVIYEQDNEQFTLPVDSMRSYVDGCIYARETAHNRIVGPITFALTAGSAFLIPKSVYVVAVPFLATGVVSMFDTKFPEEKLADKEVNPYYILGYKNTKKTKKVRSSILFGVGGLAAVFTAVFIK